VKVPVLVLGGGLSGLAAAIRAARFSPDTLLLEQHHRLGGLNSYFYRNKILYETGLHAITNYAAAGDKKAPLNRLLRQLKIRRNRFSFCQQFQSKVYFKDTEELLFSNNFDLLESEIVSKFPNHKAGFQNLLNFLDNFDPFTISPYRSAKRFLNEILGNELLVDMLLCPLMYYGSSIEDDMDLGQFAIMFRAIFLEGMFRPEGTIKDFLGLLISHYEELGGNLRTGCEVKKIVCENQQAKKVILSTGEEIECDYIISTVGFEETLRLVGDTVPEKSDANPRLGFFETIFEFSGNNALKGLEKSTITFFNDAQHFRYRSPNTYVDHSSGVICFPRNFEGLPLSNRSEVRTTHLANYSKWNSFSGDKAGYNRQKELSANCSFVKLQSIVGNIPGKVAFTNSFTPVTIERYTRKIKGAIYGSPHKIKDGDIGYKNLFLAGTDQGFMGIIGSMLSGVSIANQHVLPNL
jgi:phytoene dehydrogenase-like protein